MTSFVSMISQRLTLIGTLLLALPTVLGAQTGAPLTEHSVAAIRSVSQIQASPDGRQVAYTLSVPRTPFVDPDGGAWSRLVLLDVATGESRVFVGGDVNVGSVSYSPDGGSLLYLSRRPGDTNRALYSIPLAGGESSHLLRHSTSVDSYSLSPAGDRIAFLASDAEPEARKALRDDGFKAVAYEEDERFTRVWIASRADGDSGYADARMLPLEGNASSLSWSPAGDRLLVALAPTPLVDDSYMHRRLRVVDPSSGEVLTRIENPGKLGQTAWNPGGDLIAFISGETVHDPKEGRLMVADAETGDFRDIVPGFEGHFTRVQWLDSHTIRYIVDVGTGTEIGDVRSDGTNRHAVIPAAGVVFTSFSTSTDGSLTALEGEAFESSHGGLSPGLGGRPPPARDRFQPVAGAGRAGPAGGRPLDGARRPRDRGRPRSTAERGCGAEVSVDRPRPWGPGGAQSQRVDDFVFAAGPDGRGPRDGRAVPQLPGEHRPGCGVQHAGPRRHGGKGIR